MNQKRQPKTPASNEVKVKRRKLSDFILDPHNPNKGTERGSGMLEYSIEAFGPARSGVVDKDGVIRAGNHTAEQLAAAGIEDVIEVETDGKSWVVVKRTDMDERVGKEYAVADNRTGQLIDWNPDELKGLIEEGVDLSQFWTEAELRNLKLHGDESPGDPGDQIDKVEQLQQKWHVETGDLWEIGKHRLLCGDSTQRADVERVMAGERIEMVWTDPPYGVAVGDKNKMLNAIAPSNRVEENLENDTLDEPGLTAMLEASFDNTIAHCTAGAAWYVAAPAVPLHVLFGLVLKSRGIWRQTLQWVKNNATFSPMGVCYHWQAEPIFFGWLPDGAHRFYGGRQQTTVWEIDRPVASPEHPTMKPVEFITLPGNDCLSLAGRWIGRQPFIPDKPACWFINHQVKAGLIFRQAIYPGMKMVRMFPSQFLGYLQNP